VVPEVKLAYDNAETSVDLGLDVDEPQGRARGTYNYVVFGNKVQTLAVKGLFGCTSVFVMSRKGAWMSHFWQGPSFLFNAPDSQGFYTDVLGPLDEGYQPRQRFLNMYTLRDLRNNDNIGALGHIFDDSNMPQIWILAPMYLNPDGSDPAVTGSPPSLAFPDHIERMKAVLKDIFPSIAGPTSAGIHVKMYKPMFVPDPSDNDYTYQRGKILIQYQPAPRACQGGPRTTAKYRVWVEGSAADTIKDEWEAGQDQQVPAGQRQLDSCPQDSSSLGSSATQSSIDAGTGASSTTTPPDTSSPPTSMRSTAPAHPSSISSFKTTLTQITTFGTATVVVTVHPSAIAPIPSPTSVPPPCDENCERDKLNKGNRCNCGPNGCDAESPACCATHNCPKCVCDWEDLDHGSKCNIDCCATNTCQWANTGGRGGMWCDFNFYQRVGVRDDESFWHPTIDWEVYPWRAIHPQKGVTTLPWNTKTLISFQPEIGMNDIMEVWLNPGSPKPTGRDQFERNLSVWGLFLRTGKLEEVIQTFVDHSHEAPGNGDKALALDCQAKEFWRKSNDVWERGYNCYFPCSGDSR